METTRIAPQQDDSEAPVVPETVLNEWRKAGRWGVVEVEFEGGKPKKVREHRERKGK